MSDDIDRSTVHTSPHHATRRAAASRLDSAVPQQGFPRTATTPVADAVRVREFATTAAFWCVSTQPLAGERPAFERWLRARADAVPDDRARCVFWLAVELEADTRPYLADPDQHVRTCAALAPELAGDAAATGVLVAALHHAAEHGVPDPALYFLEAGLPFSRRECARVVG